MSSTNKSAIETVFVSRVLSRRSRPDRVERELSGLNGRSKAIVLRRATETDVTKMLSRETLVSVLRSFAGDGDIDMANAVFVALAKRIAISVANKLRLWNSIAKAQIEDVQQSVMLKFYEYFFSLEQSEELWECNFKTCFDLRLSSAVVHLLRGQIHTVSSSQTIDNDDEGVAFDIADPAAEAGYESVHVEQALMQLTSKDHRLGQSFYLKFFAELSEKEIADIMEVSERTVRNWITLARKDLIIYFAEQ